MSIVLLIYLFFSRRASSSIEIARREICNIVGAGAVLHGEFRPTEGEEDGRCD